MRPAPKKSAKRIGPRAKGKELKTKCICSMRHALSAMRPLPELMADAVSSPGKPPLDVEMGAADPAGAAFQATFIGHPDVVLFQPVNVGRADVETGLVRTLIPA